MTSLAGIIDADNVLCVAQRRCEDLGVSVRFDSSAITAYTNGHEIVLPALKQPITQDLLDTLYGYVIHETGHHLRADAFKILKAAQPPDHVCALYNIIEDDGMERERANAWRGDKKALAIMNNILITKQTNEFLEHGVGVKQEAEPIAAMLLNQMSRMDWDDYSDVSVSRLINVLPENCRDLFEELFEEDWIQRMRSGTNPHDTWDITIDLAKRLYPNNPEEEYEEIREAGHSMDQARDTSEDTMEDSKNGKAKDGEQGEGTALSNDGGRGEDDVQDTASDGEGRVVSWKDAVLSEHNEWEPQQGPPGTIGIDWTGMGADSSDVCLMPTNLVNVVDLKESKASCTGGRGYGNRHWKTYMPCNQESRAFANRIRRYIQAEARSVVDKEKYHGKLDKSALVRLAMPPIDGGEYNKKIFYDQRKHIMKDTAIFVLTDWSGSMSGLKMQLAADASQRLVHVFERILKVPVALAAFSNGSTRCDIGHIKPFNTRGLPAEEIAKRFAKFYHYSSANNDADSVHWAWRELLKRKEKRKILIVLSDGCPAGCWKGWNDEGNLKFVTKSIEKDGRVELYGVGICSGAVSNYYTNNKVLNSPEEINETLFRIIKEGNNV